MHDNRINHLALVTSLLLGAGLMLASTTVTAADDSETESLRVEDPMQPSWLRKRATKQAQPETRTRFTVDTIVVSPDRRVAVINGRSVGVGNTINGARVLEIEPDRVTLDVDGTKLTIEMTISNIKTVAKDGG